MPDPTKKTISATEMSGLLGVSPYVTKWMLFQRFAHGVEAPGPDHNRLDWGTKMEPLLLEQAAADLRLEVKTNRQADGSQIYVRRNLLGCSRDADIYDPQRGPGALETKCCFDYKILMQEWNGGKTPPRQHEIQLQQQMYVGDGVKAFDGPRKRITYKFDDQTDTLNIGGGYFERIGVAGDVIGFAFFGLLSAMLVRQALGKTA